MKIGTWRDGLKPIIIVALKLSVMLFGVAGATGGFFLGTTIFPKNDNLQLAVAAAGLAVGVVIWWPLAKLLARWL